MKTNQADCNILPSPVDKVHGKNVGNVEKVSAKHAGVVQDVEQVVEPVVEVINNN